MRGRGSASMAEHTRGKMRSGAYAMNSAPVTGLSKAGQTGKGLPNARRSLALARTVYCSLAKHRIGADPALLIQCPNDWDSLLLVSQG